MTTKDTEAGRTPLPWAVGPPMNPRVVELKRVHWQIGSKETLAGIGFIFGASDADAQFIVQSVNERAGLVAECEKRAALLGESERLRLRFLDTIAARDREVARLREALEEIERMKGMTILGPDSRHNMGVGAPCYHEMGAAVAFEQAAAIAELALRSVQGGAQKE